MNLVVLKTNNQIIMKKILAMSFVAFSIYGNAQTTTTPAPAEKEWDVNLYGFIRTDYIFDTRKSAQVREYNLNLYPLDEQLDTNGDDINAAEASNFLSIVSRLGVKVKGPNVWGAKMTGVLEGDFFWKYRVNHRAFQIASCVCQHGVGKNHTNHGTNMVSYLYSRGFSWCSQLQHRYYVQPIWLGITSKNKTNAIQRIFICLNRL